MRGNISYIILLTCLSATGCSSNSSTGGEKLDDETSIASEQENGRQFMGNEPIFNLARLLAADTSNQVNSLNQLISSGATLSDEQAQCSSEFNPALGEPLLEFDCASQRSGKLIPTTFCLEQASNGAAQNCALESASLVLPLAWTVPDQNDENSVRPVPLLGATISYVAGQLRIDTAEQVGNPATTCAFNLDANGSLVTGEADNCLERVSELIDRLEGG